MTKSEAINFLKHNQPMPNDDELRKSDIIKTYEKVRLYFIDNPNEECIPLFLNSFGGKDGLGVYQLVEEVIAMYDHDVVIPHIMEALNNPLDSIMYWSVQIASDFPDSRLFAQLSKLLLCEDADIKLATITTLAQ